MLREKSQAVLGAVGHQQKGKETYESHFKGRKLACGLIPMERPLLWQRSEPGGIGPQFLMLDC